MGMLRDLRKKVSKKLGTAICCFQDPSLEDMALKYPISYELINIHGVEKESEKIWCRICRINKSLLSIMRLYVQMTWL
jgi:hypothetical protein